MRLFNLSFKNRRDQMIPIKDEEYANQLFKDLQSWIANSTDVPIGVTVKSFDNRYIIFKVEELSHITVSKMENKDYDLIFDTLY